VKTPQPDSGLVGGAGVLNRGTDSTAEDEIRRLLVARFDDPDDPRLQGRREALERACGQVPLDRAGALLDRLTSGSRGDELAAGFGRLSDATQNALRKILSERASTFRAVFDRANSRQAREEAGDPKARSDYIDTVYTTIGFNGMLGNVTLYWDERRRYVVVPIAHVELKHVESVVELFQIRDSRDAAMNDVARWQKDAGTSKVIGYYVGPHGVILPTLFCDQSTPMIVGGLPGLMHEYFADMTAGWNQLANALNPVPFTRVDEQGGLSFHFDFATAALALLVLIGLRGRGGGAKQRGGPVIEVRVTPKEANAIGELRTTLEKGGSWTDLPAQTRTLLGSFFHKTVEPIAAFIYRGVGAVRTRVTITKELIKELAATGGRSLFVEGKLVDGKKTRIVDFAEIDFAKKRVIVLDLTSIDRSAHIAKTRELSQKLSELTGIKADAIELHYIGDEAELLETLTEFIVPPKKPPRGGGGKKK
jgi:hypothetical protein